MGREAVDIAVADELEGEEMRSILQIQAEMIDRQKVELDLAREHYYTLRDQVGEYEDCPTDLYLRYDRAFDKKWMLGRRHLRMLNRDFRAIEWMEIISELLLDRLRHTLKKGKVKRGYGGDRDIGW